MKWLDKAVEKDYNGMKASDVVELSKKGLVSIWRLNVGEGIIVTELVNANGYIYLYVSYNAGKGFLQNIDDIKSFLVGQYKPKGAKAIRVSASRPGLQKLYERKYTELTRIYQEEI